MRGPLPASRAVALVARREFRAQVVKKSFVISNVIVLLVIAGGIVAFAVFGGSGDDRPAVGVAGPPALAATVTAAGDRLGLPVDVRPVGSADAGRDAVLAGDLDVAVVPAADGAVAIVTEEVPGPVRAVLDAALQQQARDTALTGLGVDPAELDRSTAPAVLTVDAADPPDPEAGQRTALSFVALFLLFGQILGFGTYVAMGVVEEKSSRVVELLLSTIKPLHLLWGKIVGIGAVGLLQLALYGVVGLTAGLATGVLTLTATAVGVFASVLGWFVLGFAFYSVLYAAAGSMVSRQEDINTTTGPLMLSLFLLYGAAFYHVSSPDDTLVTVLSWIPPFSAILMPLRIADGSATVVQIVATVLLMLAAVAALAWASARIYHRSVLRIGAAVPWREALGRSR
ncbi:putative ABC transporter, permease component [Pseudonocardia sp. Ae168_Ps1]|uniref:ABC transporter permease n=1 Tax=unclassified Pseudonocardia TaxID=2619320 RepID=UPI00094B40CD|nr:MULTISPECIES: ABC transporter permease [unclassified Pseudonocardia]OLL72556.1 putative ABC transporter, permease component [Pseudonocardia sp. Ae150A_Ps1]OLL78528.1 putative ABC transporter, permease component [Pseudonocardia sp. Ae168_Ps1]OLL87347.1 putative ABC transporter, permease component [Pseudonocardia sp. Ae263_Ps1]OLL92624.1 putative ABC transporter, permease component [Pseudonocardia sp. Ae356_Ps1]